jgi:hypothetical protein
VSRRYGRKTDRSGPGGIIVNGTVIPVIGTIDIETDEIEFDTVAKQEDIARIGKYGHRLQRKKGGGRKSRPTDYDDEES